MARGKRERGRERESSPVGKLTVDLRQHLEARNVGVILRLIDLCITQL